MNGIFTMRILPLIYLEHLTEEEIDEHECSDRVWLPSREFERYMQESEPGVVALFRIVNSVEQSVVGTLYNPHTEDTDTMYMPRWMISCLDLDDSVTLELVQPSLCTRIVLQPHTSEHIHAEDPQELLRDAFERYTCVTSGSTIPLWVGTTMEVTIVSVFPESNAPLCIRNCEIELELLRPFDMPEQEEKQSESGADTETETEPVGEQKEAEPGILLGGVAHHVSKSRREIMAEAALRRLHKN
jgi:hypothetical protein